MQEDKTRLQNMVNNIAKSCERLTRDARAYEDYTEKEQAAYDDDKPGSKGVGAYFQDCLDIEYRISSDGNYRGVSVLVACGGPNIWIDTKRGDVVGVWWDNKATADISLDAMSVINDHFREIYEATR